MACYLSGQKPVLPKNVFLSKKDVVLLSSREGFSKDKNAYAKAYFMVKKLFEGSK